MRHFKKRKKSCFLTSEINVKYVFSNTAADVADAADDAGVS